MLARPRVASSALLAVLSLVLLSEPAPVARLHELTFDAYQRLMPRTRGSAPVVIVEIDEHALHRQGQWPWPRTVMARLVEGVARGNPAAIGLDLLFSEPDRMGADADAALARALKTAPTVLGMAGLEQHDRRFPHPPRTAPVRTPAGGELPLRRFEGHLQSLPTIDQGAAGRGLLSTDQEGGVVRRVPLVAGVGTVLAPSLTVELIRVAAGLPLLAVEGDRTGAARLRLGDLDIPVQPDGRLRIYFGPHDPARFVSAQDVLEGRVADEVFRDRIVLIGMTGLGLLDFQTTPLGERIPGVEVHAQVLEQIFDGAHIVRPAGASAIEAGLLLAAGAILVAVVPAASALATALTGLLVVAALVLAGVLAFRAGLVIDTALPAAGATIVLGVMLAFAFAEADRQRRRLREAQARLEGELEAARRIQVGLLPDAARVFPGERRFTLEAFLAPARTVGGDFYDCFMLDEDRLFFLVADVSGKGLPASLFMALSKALIKSIALREREVDPGELLTVANAEIHRDNAESLFVTAFAAVLHVPSGRLAFSNAGHEPALCLREGYAPETLEHAGGPPLCVIPGFRYPTSHRQLLPGETVCVLSDGVTEALNPHGELYGSARVRSVMGASRQTTSMALIDALARDVRHFSQGADQADDITLLALRWSGPSTER